MSNKIYADIALEGLQVPCCLGVTEAERSVPQRLVLTLKMLKVDITEAVKTDCITSTVNYAEVAIEIKAFLAAQSAYHLLERLVYSLAEHLLARFLCRKISLTVKKYPFDMLDVAGVVITVEREKE